MSKLSDIEDQEFLVGILTQASEDLKDILTDLTADFQERFGEDANPLYLHIQLLAQHLGRAIALGPMDMRDELISEAQNQAAMVIAHHDEPDDEVDLLSMKAQGNA